LGASVTLFRKRLPIKESKMRVCIPKTAYLLLIVIAILFSHSASAQWEYSHYDIYPDQMFDCACVDSSTFWAVGSFGYVIKSTDSGRTWSPFSYAHLTDNLRKVDFPDAKHGFAASQYGVTIIATVDSGNTWNVACQNVPLGYISGLAFADSLHGFLSGNLLIYRTTDGGYTWIVPDSFPANLGITDIRLINKDTILACGATNTDPYHPMIIKTVDGGVIWDVIATLGDTLDAWIRAIYFSDQRHGWITVQPSHSYMCYLYASSDCGSNWELIQIFNDGPSSHALNNIVAQDSLNLRIAGDTYLGGNIRKSTDGGHNWFFEWMGYAGAVRGFSMFDSTHGLVVGGPISDNTPLLLYYNSNSNGINNSNIVSPRYFEVSETFPNPFNSSCAWEIKEMPDEIVIYDINGKTTRKIVPLLSQIIWDGKNYSGQEASSGIYFAMFKKGGQRIIKKAIRLK
jgi:photosystem II stability/assembly factor-like uncharacterized protein